MFAPILNFSFRKSIHLAICAMSVPPDFLISGEDIEDMKKRIRKFKLSQLKDLARTLLLRIAGKKADLVERIEEHIENGVRYDDKIKLLVIGVIIKKILLHESIPSYTSLYNAIRFGGPNANVLAQLQQDTRSISARPDSEALSNMAPVPQMPRPRSTDASNGYTNNAIYFKPSPFYSLKQLILGSPQRAYKSPGRSVVGLNFVLSEEDNRIFRSKPGKMQVLLLCGAFDYDVPVTQSANVEFPIPLEIYVNGVQLKENVKGIKGKPGTARPANITKLISRSPALNRIEMVYAGSKKDYLLYCFIAETRTSQEIADEVVRGQHIHLLSTIEKIKEEYTHGDDDLEVATSSLSLKCPLTYSRMKFPAKSIYCQHIQCFDCLSFLQLQEQIPTWTCPICSRKVELEELAISDYYLEILLKVNDDVESVTLQPDGSWLANVESPVDSSASPSPKPNFVPDEVIEIVSVDSESEDEAPQPPLRPLEQAIDTSLPELVSATVSHPREQFTAEWNRHTTPLAPSVIALHPLYDEDQQVDSPIQAHQNAQQNETVQQNENSPIQSVDTQAAQLGQPQQGTQQQSPQLQNRYSVPDMNVSQSTQLQGENATHLQTPNPQAQGPDLSNSVVPHMSAEVQSSAPQLPSQSTHSQNNGTHSHTEHPVQTPVSRYLNVPQLPSPHTSVNGERHTSPPQSSLPAINTLGPAPYQNVTSSEQRSTSMSELLPNLNGQATQVPQQNPPNIPLPPLRANSATGTLPGLSTFSFEPSTPRPQDYLDVRSLEQTLTSMFRIKRAMNTRQEQVLNHKDLQERHEQLRTNFQNNLRQNLETNGHLRPSEVVTDTAPEAHEYQRPGLMYSRSAFDLLAASREDSRPLPKKSKTINGQSPVGISPLNGQIEDFTLRTPQPQRPAERTWNKRLHSEDRSPSPTK